MSLLNQYVQNYGQLGPFFERIREAQAPSKFSQQFLKDIGFTSSNYRAYIPLLKGLGFLSDDGSPKSEYMQLLDATQWRKAIARALLKSYSDIFVLKSKPTKSDKAAIIGKYKTTFNVTENVADRAANTFLALLDLADDATLSKSAEPETMVAETIAQPPASKEASEAKVPSSPLRAPLDLCYNIQIHLPPTKDVEVYNAIFKSLREHFID